MTDADTLFVGLGIGIFFTTIAYIFYKQFISRLKSTSFYSDHVIAYKVGLIKDKAEKNNIVLAFPPHRVDLIDAIEEEVESNLDSTDIV